MNKKSIIRILVGVITGASFALVLLNYTVWREVALNMYVNAIVTLAMSVVLYKMFRITMTLIYLSMPNFFDTLHSIKTDDTNSKNMHLAVLIMMPDVKAMSYVKK